MSNRFTQGVFIAFFFNLDVYSVSIWLLGDSSYSINKNIKCHIINRNLIDTKTYVRVEKLKTRRNYCKPGVCRYYNRVESVGHKT